MLVLFYKTTATFSPEWNENRRDAVIPDFIYTMFSNDIRDDNERQLRINVYIVRS